jgi:hypothetical protein
MNAMLSAIEARRCKAMATLAAFSAREQVPCERSRSFAQHCTPRPAPLQAWAQLGEARTLRRVADLLAAAVPAAPVPGATSAAQVRVRYGRDPHDCVCDHTARRLARWRQRAWRRDSSRHSRRRSH